MAELTSLVAKRPVRRAPIVPPTPCTPKASSESSYPSLALRTATAKKQTAPPIRPMSSAEGTVTKPAAGVTTTRPATRPDTAPRALGLPRCHHSMPVQLSMAAAEAKWVDAKALVARLPALSALPALKPNQPTQSRPAPIIEYTTLCGGMGCPG